ncbi:MAG: hypothetical protein VXW87_04795 [Pseudomonadota bacterium]|nr:hypothetical protein [Pseudomonadota bacterium]
MHVVQSLGVSIESLEGNALSIKVKFESSDDVIARKVYKMHFSMIQANATKKLPEEYVQYQNALIEAHGATLRDIYVPSIML